MSTNGGRTPRLSNVVDLAGLWPAESRQGRWRMDQTPMPARVNVSLTVREDGTREGLPVAVVTMFDAAGEARVIHLGEEVLMELFGDLAVAWRQLHHGSTTMPPAWQLI